MKKMNAYFARLSVLALSMVCFAGQSRAGSADTFQLRIRSNLNGSGAVNGPHGWASSSYNHRNGTTNQSLQINCQGLDANHVYHLMASWGTNGDLMHLSDFTASHSGVITMQFIAGGWHHFVGTNAPYIWGMMGDWTNGMSWVIYPGAGTNWCDWMAGGSPRPLMMGGGMGGGGTGGTNGWGDNCDDWIHDWSGMGWERCGWPAMTNWSVGSTNVWPMTNWCWDYTNMWNGAVLGGGATNWWGNVCRGSYHDLPLPPAVNPVPVLNGLVVMDANLHPVLSADLANPGNFSYQVRCAFSNHGIIAGANGTMQASETQHATHFKMSLSGLTPSTDYVIVINGVTASPAVSDSHGRLQVRVLPGGMSLQGVGSIALQDHNFRTILSATLPPD